MEVSDVLRRSSGGFASLIPRPHPAFLRFVPRPHPAFLHLVPGSHPAFLRLVPRPHPAFLCLVPRPHPAFRCLQYGKVPTRSYEESLGTRLAPHVRVLILTKQRYRHGFHPPAPILLAPLTLPPNTAIITHDTTQPPLQLNQL